MKSLTCIALLLLLPVSSMAGPMNDFIIGGVFLVLGAGAQSKSGQFASDKNTAKAESTRWAETTLTAFHDYAYFEGAADLEFEYFGVTADYYTLLNASTIKMNEALNAANTTNSCTSKMEDSRDKENMYKGFAQASYFAGGFMVGKGLWGLIQQHFAKTSLARKIELTPTSDMSGGQLVFNQKF